MNSGNSLWLETSKLDDYPSMPPPNCVEYAVIGGGLTGLNAALTIAEAGGKCAVFDSDLIGGGASSHNGGTVSLGVSGNYKDISKLYGHIFAFKYMKLGVEALELLDAQLKRFTIDCDFYRGGRIKVAFSKRQYQDLFKEAEFYERFYGHHYRILDQEALMEESLIASANGGLFEPMSATLHPGKLLKSLIDLLLNYQVGLISNTSITGIENRNGKFILTHSSGTTTAERVIIAVNGDFKRNIFPQLRRAIIPIGSHVIVTCPLDSDQVELISKHRRTFSTARNFLNYWQITADNRLLFGGRSCLSTNYPLSNASRDLEQRMKSLLPAARSAKITHCWGGKLGFTFDRMPRIGIQDGIFFAGGYCGHGIPFATLCGHAVGTFALRESTSHILASHPPLKPWYYRKKTWFLPLVSNYYKLMDMIS